MSNFRSHAWIAAAVLLSVAACKGSKPADTEANETAAPQAVPSQTAAPTAPATPQEIAAVQQHLDYPPLAKAAGIQGTVLVRAVMDDAGQLVDTQVDSKLGGGLEESAIEAVRAAWDSPDLATLKQQAQPAASGRREVSVPVVFRV